MPTIKLEIVLDKKYLMGLKAENINWKEVLELWNAKRKKEGGDAINYPLFMYHIKNLGWQEQRLQKTSIENVQAAIFEKNDLQETRMEKYPKSYARITRSEVLEIIANKSQEEYVIYVLGEKPDQPETRMELWEDKRMEIITHFDDLKNQSK